jgi:hypothetical protein
MADHILRERVLVWKSGWPCSSCIFSISDNSSVGGDVQLGADSCFSYRHSRKAGDGLISYDPSYFLAKQKVDTVSARIAALKKKKPAACKAKLLAEVLEACEASWDAANENKQKVDPKCHDVSGIFVMTCHHSQVLFLCGTRWH